MEECVDVIYLVVAVLASFTLFFPLGMLFEHALHGRKEKKDEPVEPKPDAAYRSTKQFRRLQNNGNWMVKYIEERLRKRDEFKSYHVYAEKERMGSVTAKRETPVYLITINSTEFPPESHYPQIASVWYDTFEGEAGVVVFQPCFRSDPSHKDHGEEIEDRGDRYMTAAEAFMDKFIAEELRRRAEMACVGRKS